VQPPTVIPPTHQLIIPFEFLLIVLRGIVPVNLRLAVPRDLFLSIAQRAFSRKFILVVPEICLIISEPSKGDLSAICEHVSIGKQLLTLLTLSCSHPNRIFLLGANLVIEAL
jgi:hypothetical protein